MPDAGRSEKPATHFSPGDAGYDTDTGLHRVRTSRKRLTLESFTEHLIKPTDADLLLCIARAERQGSRQPLLPRTRSTRKSSTN